jgi:adenine-specific DNA methylase
MKVFRPIHYLGSKLRLLDVILGVIDSFCPEGSGVVDIFSGSGVVSKGLSGRHPVVSVDIQEYARVIGSALLLPFLPVKDFSKNDLIETSVYKSLYKTFEPLIDFEYDALGSIDVSPRDIEALLDVGPLIVEQSFKKKCIPRLSASVRTTRESVKKIRAKYPCTIAEYYGGVYFSYEQAIMLDACLYLLDQFEPLSRNIFHAAVLSTASDIANTVGRQFAQPVTVKKRDGEFKTNILRKIKRDRAVNVGSVLSAWLEKYNSQEQPRYLNAVIQGDYTNAFPVSPGFQTVYADPPYTRAHYSRYYHVLETLARRDRPTITQSNIPTRFVVSKGVYRNDRVMSEFGIRSKADNAFNKLFSLCSSNKLNLVLSYSPFCEGVRTSPRIVTVKRLTDLIARYYKKVEVVSCGTFAHSKLTTVENQLTAPREAEVLIVARI